MQVFIIGTPLETARALDPRRLNKQRIEARQILDAIMGRSAAWRNHPCTIQYRNHYFWLQTYSLILDTFCAGLHVPSYINKYAEISRPNFHTPEYFDQMKRRLYTKDPNHYRQWEHLGTSETNWYFVDGTWKYYENGKLLKK